MCLPSKDCVCVFFFWLKLQTSRCMLNIDFFSILATSNRRIIETDKHTNAGHFSIFVYLVYTNRKLNVSSSHHTITERYRKTNNRKWMILYKYCEQIKWHKAHRVVRTQEREKKKKNAEEAIHWKEYFVCAHRIVRTISAFNLWNHFDCSQRCLFVFSSFSLTHTQTVP